MLSVELEIAIQVAASEAQVRRHEFFGLEHMLYALLHDSSTAQVLEHCNGQVKALRDTLNTYLHNEIVPVPDEIGRAHV